MKRENWNDYTEDFCQMYASAERNQGKREMYSYDRPAYQLWNAFMNGLIEAGYSEDAAREWLTSKAARWALDGKLGDKIARLGYEFARKESHHYATKEQCEQWARETKKQAA